MLPADLLNDDCSSLTGWTILDVSPGVTSVSPAGEFKLDTHTYSGANWGNAFVQKGVSNLPLKYTVKTRSYFDAIGTTANLDYAVIVCAAGNQFLNVIFASDGLYVHFNEVGTNIVKCNGSAHWQTWRFQVDRSNGDANSVVEILLDNEDGNGFVSQGTVNYGLHFLTPEFFAFQQNGQSTNSRISHFDYIQIASGLGDIATWTVPLTDSDALSDSFSRAVSFIESFSDSPTLSDNFSRTASFKIGLNDSNILSDNEIISTLLSLVDTSSLADDIFNKAPNLLKTDSPTLTDDIELNSSSVLASISVEFSPVMLVNQSQVASGIGTVVSGGKVTVQPTWTSSNPLVATIDSNGLIVAIKPGITFITATLGVYKSQPMLLVNELTSNIFSSANKNFQQIPLDNSPNQSFSSTLYVDGRNISLKFQLRWNGQAGYWVMTLIDPNTGNYLVDSIPLMAGVLPTMNLLQPYSYLGIGSCFIANISNIHSDYPTDKNLGKDYILLWSDTEVL